MCVCVCVCGGGGGGGGGAIYSERAFIMNHESGSSK